MWCPKVSWRWRTSAPNRPQPKADVTAHVKRTLEVELPMEVAMIAELMTFMRDPSHEVRPTLRVTAQDEKCCAHAFLGESVEDSWGRIGIRAIVEGESDNFSITVDLPQRPAEDRTITMESAVRYSAEYGNPQCRKPDHS
jgi:hypothetical protein